MLSVVRQKRFIWDRDDKKGAIPTNYDYNARPRRQEFPGYFVENGAFYITTRKGLLQTQNRLNGKIGLYEMPSYTYHELDDQEDWAIMECFAKNIKNFYSAQWVKPIKVVALDVDGVLTDGTIYRSGSGEKPLKFSRVDGKGIELLKQNNLDVWVISSEDSTIVRKRCAKLGITNILLGIKDKLKCIKKLTKDNQLKSTEICFIGDDVQDISTLQWVGFSAAPQNAVDKVKSRVNYLCSNYGGAGAVREVIDLILNFKQTKSDKNNSNRQ
jgi:N-acylneuraminate cytidylyltransferase